MEFRVYMESGFANLKPMIYKRQLSFFRKFKENCNANPKSSISNVFSQAMNSNVTFLRHYKQLDRTFTTPNACYRHYLNEHETNSRAKTQAKYDVDNDSILGTYLRINPNLKSPQFYRETICNEHDRKIITRYRTGYHKLKINKGRQSNIDRENRLCSCDSDIQTLHHVLFNCPLTVNIRLCHNIDETNLKEFFDNENHTRTACILRSMESALSL